MKCYHPLRAFRTPTGVVFSELSRHDIIGEVDLPCGQCVGCRERRASDWSLRVMHEASLYAENCFVTLTYARDCLPTFGSLDHRDFQLFLKRLRKSRGHVRFYMCGEYGPLNLRPHYHACLFNVNFYDRVVSGKSAAGAVFYDSGELRDFWKLGRVSVQDLTRETAGYCARYIMKKVLGPPAEAAYSFVDADGEVHPLKPEYAAMSLKPGIGARWFARYGFSDVFPQDFVVSEGVKRQVPKYYDKLLKRRAPLSADEVRVRRELEASAHREEQLPARLEVCEAVHLAKVSVFTRNVS